MMIKKPSKKKTITISIFFGIFFGLLFLVGNINYLEEQSPNKNDQEWNIDTNEHFNKQYEENPTKNQSLEDFQNPQVATNFLTENLSNPNQISENNIQLGYNSKPKMVLDENQNSHYIWVEDRGDGKQSVMYRNFYYKNQSWGNILNVSDYQNQEWLSDIDPDMIVSENRAFIVWKRKDQTIPDRYSIFFMVIEDEIIKTSEKIRDSYFQDDRESDLKINKNKNGDLLISALTCSSTGTTDYLSLTILNDGDNWGDWSSEFEILTNQDYEYNNIIFFDVFWDENEIIHTVFQLETYEIYYGKNTTNLENEGGSFSFESFNALYNLEGNPNNLMFKGNINNNHLYLGFDNGTDCFLVNKTFSDSNFNIDECFTKNGFVRIKFDFNKENSNITVIYQTTGSSPDLYIISNLTSSSQLLVHDDTLTSVISSSDIETSFDNKDINIMYADAFDSKLYFKKLDRSKPNLNITRPITNGAYNDKLQFEFTSEPDTRIISYEYVNDTDQDEIPDGSSEWTLINTTRRVKGVNMTADLNFTWNIALLDDLQYAIFRINATDFAGLNETHFIYNVTFDSAPPNKVELNRIFDNNGNSVVSDNFVKENITIEYNVSDLISGVSLIELRNGTRKGSPNPNSEALFTTTNITLGNNGWTQTLWETTSEDDGNWTKTFLRAYDASGYYNDSEYIGGYMYIDNTAPKITEINPTIDNGREISGAYEVEFKIDSEEVDFIKAQFYGYIGGVYGYDLYNAISLIEGLALPDGNNWTFTWNTDEYEISSEFYELNGNYTLNITTFDNYGNHESYLRNVTVDNQEPVPIFITPNYNEELALQFMVNFSVDKDIQNFELRYGEGNLGINDVRYNFPRLETIDYNYNLTTDQSFYYINLTLNFNDESFIKDPDYIDTNPEITLAVRCIDDQGLEGFGLRIINLHTKIPDTPKDLSATIYPAKENGKNTGKFDIRLSFKSSFEIRNYLIYRSLYPFDVENLNEMNYEQRLEFLGMKKGEKYCIGNVTVTGDEVPTNLLYLDNSTYANSYYYAIIAIDQFGNPSNLSQYLEVETPLVVEGFEENAIKRDYLESMLYIGIVAAIFMPIVGTTITRSLKKKKRKKAITQEMKQMEGHGDDFLDMEIEGESEPEEIPDVDELLSEKVEEEEEESILGKSSVKKCPNCGWMLSKDATKCPRCGRDYY